MINPTQICRSELRDLIQSIYCAIQTLFGLNEWVSKHYLFLSNHSTESLNHLFELTQSLTLSNLSVHKISTNNCAFLIDLECKWWFLFVEKALSECLSFNRACLFKERVFNKLLLLRREPSLWLFERNLRSWLQVRTQETSKRRDRRRRCK